eukprot:CAMPEP_0118645844 /NCGR_PEP_ID=MMETSP0785-20121206/7728_1 /TAXON_ID=91992 /ORGANISM="Bolidomonas pacifica, Strain CCMP 1866" /LENGTH=189 /DNA_ID=CAMNT_0006537775 /DNA_START=12 /DNA_END=578 /DNA_ORIENTATION=+
MRISPVLFRRLFMSFLAFTHLSPYLGSLSSHSFITFLASFPSSPPPSNQPPLELVPVDEGVPVRSVQDGCPQEPLPGLLVLPLADEKEGNGADDAHVIGAVLDGVHADPLLVDLLRRLYLFSPQPSALWALLQAHRHDLFGPVLVADPPLEPCALEPEPVLPLVFEPAELKQTPSLADPSHLLFKSSNS